MSNHPDTSTLAALYRELGQIVNVPTKRGMLIIDTHRGSISGCEHYPAQDLRDHSNAEETMKIIPACQSSYALWYWNTYKQLLRSKRFATNVIRRMRWF